MNMVFWFPVLKVRDMSLSEDLLSVADRLQNAPEIAELLEAEPILEALKDVATQAERAFSGSWLGYHANVYYAKLQPPPPGSHFSPVWGLDDDFGMGTKGDWQESDPHDLEKFLRKCAGDPDLTNVEALAAKLNEKFRLAKDEFVSICHLADSSNTDSIVSDIRSEFGKLTPMTPSDVILDLRPKGIVATKDMKALSQGSWIPPHVKIRAQVASIYHSVGICRRGAELSRTAANHLKRKARYQMPTSSPQGNHVFIGHGRSNDWRELKDFVQDRLGLTCDEFNRVPTAGVSIQTRLTDMLNSASMAFLVLTAEEDTVDGQTQARMNVIHEVGLFQGRLGFGRAIVMLEDGCAEFSNIAGLGQIRFARGQINSKFEEVRRLLEREGLLQDISERRHASNP